MSSQVETGIGIFWALRELDPRSGGELAGLMAQSGAVDEVVIWDQMTSWWPNALWTPDVTAQASQLKDIDALSDPFITIAFALAANENLGWAVSTDALRRDPPELFQSALTLSNATHGKSRLLLGAGEVRHINPYGRKRSEGLARLRDTLKIARQFFTAEKPFDFDGEIWKYRKAWIGNARNEPRPDLFALGGGPHLIDAAVELADGWVSGVPFVFSTPEEYSAEVVRVKESLANHGRDPESFVFGLYHLTYLCDDRQEFLDNIEHPLLKWYAATGGRLNQRHWASEGLESVYPDDWHYALHMRPAHMTRAEVDEILNRTTAEHVDKTCIAGTPSDVAQILRPYTDAGCSYHLIIDYAPLVGAEPTGAINRAVELCRLLKQ